MRTTVTQCLVLAVAVLSAVPASAALSLARITNAGTFDYTLHSHFVGESADGHQVDVTLRQSLIDTPAPAFYFYRPGESISLFTSISWNLNFVQSLTVDSIPFAGTPLFAYPTLELADDGIHGDFLGDLLFIDGTVLAPPAPVEPTVQQSITVQAPFAYSDIDFMVSLVNPRSPSGQPLFVDPLFFFAEPAGTGLVGLELLWLPHISVWEGANVEYRFSVLTVPEHSSIALAAVALGGLIALCRRKRVRAWPAPAT